MVSCECLWASIAAAICVGSVRTILNVLVGFWIQGMSDFLKERGGGGRCTRCFLEEVLSRKVRGFGECADEISWRARATIAGIVFENVTSS